MTETGAGAVVIANREPRHVGASCFGREGDDVEVKLVADSGAPAGVDEPGELLVRHAGADSHDGFFAGYLKDKAATDEAWAGGWFHTGDIVRRGADGQLHFIDRRKNVIRRSGENISAVEVESVLLQHPRVKAAAVSAVPDAVRGDEVLACIVSEGVAGDVQSRRAAAADIVDWCLARLAYYKAPGYVAFVDGLPLTTSQKVQRGELRTLAVSLVGQANCVDTVAMKKRQA
jgi:acyl-CoA synthetase (AMP-forming)/AMP-acid ligase II